MPGRTQALSKALLASLLLVGCGELASGVDAYREGRFRDAHAAFRKAEESAGNGASAALSFNRALAALRAGDLSDAEAAAQRAAARGGPEMAARCDFLRGNAAFARCRLAERQASTAAAEPFAWDVAIIYARKARDAWQRAAMSRPDWPAARRNVERALLKIEELKRKKAEQDQRPPRPPGPQPPPPPQPPEARGKEDEPAPADEPQLEELAPEQVLRLLDRLAQKEQEKRALRRSHRKARMAEVERDW
ncbi:MAG: hypothetical protein ACYTEZ_08240 [Planctomycetota bacterium]|jgi:tetratricopeptide (TPR) repeat protein